MNIGVGITVTSARPEHEKYWQDIAFNLTEGMTVTFVKDVKGIAAAKNECLRRLKDCDHIFLFDDDCFPIANGWESLFIEASNKTQYHHFNYLCRTQSIRPIEYMEGVDIVAYNNTAGCMMYLTKELLSKVGAFNEAFGIYGYEHAEYSFRCMKAQETIHAYVCPAEAQNYIYSLDLNDYLTFSFKHHPTLSTDEMVKALHVSTEQFKKEVKDIYIPL
jgi:hypothetical protein